MASVGIALESAEQTSRAANQVSLFSEDDITAENPPLISVPQWMEKEKLQNEKMALGFYLSGHPFNAYADELKKFVPTQLDRLNPQREPQLLAGIIYSIRIQVTRRGRMGVIVLDDGNARVELVVYSELFDANRNWLKEDQLLVVEAKVSSKGGNEENGGGLRISADKLFDLAGARSRYAKSMQLHCNGLSNAVKLRDLLAPYRNTENPNNTNSGNNCCYCPVSVIYRNQNATCEIELGDAWRVNLHDNLLQSLSAHFQAENVRVVYR